MADDDDNSKVDASLDNTDRDTDEGDEQGGSKKKLILLIAIPLLLLGGSAAAYFTGMLDSLVGSEKANEQSAEDKTEDMNSNKEDSAEQGKAGGPVFMEMPVQRVNLNSPDGDNTYLQLTIQLEVKNEQDKARVEEVMPRVIDQFQTYLRELRVRDLRGSAGIYRLQAELLDRVNAAAAPVEVQDVLFQEILIQNN